MSVNNQEKKRYSGDEVKIKGIRSFSLQEKLDSNRYTDKGYSFVKHMDGKDFTISYIQKYNFVIPLLFKDKTSLGLHVPSQQFSVNDICTHVGSERVLDVIDVNTQEKFKMTMKTWTKYYEDPEKDKLLNVISLEFSHTQLEKYIKPPNIVRELDWVDCVWPKHLKESQTQSTNVIDDKMYPTIQKYCFMSVKGCYADFHIDFGGTSVWYHILKGSIVCWLIPPLQTNIELYKKWILSGKQGDVFFGDTVEHCNRVSFNAGDTFFIPSAWIYAVYTSDDTIAFGGYFLHSFNIILQLSVAEVEESMKVLQKYRYPYFTEMLWYVLARYVYCNLGISHLNEGTERPPPAEHVNFNRIEPHGLGYIIKYFYSLPLNEKNVPPLIKDPIELLKNVTILLIKHRDDRPEDDVTGKSILKIQGDEMANKFKKLTVYTSDDGSIGDGAEKNKRVTK